MQYLYSSWLKCRLSSTTQSFFRMTIYFIDYKFNRPDALKSKRTGMAVSEALQSAPEVVDCLKIAVPLPVMMEQMLSTPFSAVLMILYLINKPLRKVINGGQNIVSHFSYIFTIVPSFAVCKKPSAYP